MKKEVNPTRIIPLKYPFPECNMEFLEYNPSENIGYSQGVFTDGIPFVAELWKAAKTEDLNMTVILPFVDDIMELAVAFMDEDLEEELEELASIEKEIEEKEAEQEEELDDEFPSNIAGFERSEVIHTTELLCNDMVIIDEVFESDYLLLLIEYLKYQGIIEFTTVMENGHAYVLEDFAGEIVLAIHITLREGNTTFATTPLVFQPFHGENVDKVNLKAKFHIVKEEKE